MNRIKTILLASMASVMVAQAGNEQEVVSGNYLNNRQPLFQKDYIELPLGAIRAEGWMQEQLIRMKEGMTGHLDKVYEHVMGARNGWLGGDGDVWERGPYWIDGLLPLAYILNDEVLMEKIKPWVEWALASQKPNGYFGPDTDRTPEPGLQRDNAHDWWPKMVMLKVLQQYYSATEDARVLDFFTKYFKYQLAELPKTPLGHWTFWGEQRGGDNLMMVYWLYNITGDKFLLDLGELIHKQTFNWTDVFLNQDHLSRQHSLHCVNLGQGFKEPVVYYQQNKDPKQIEAVESAVHQIHNTIGLPTGLWGGDELLRFGRPTAGSELCTAVEMMYSLEEILEITGEVQWADYLERVAYRPLRSAGRLSAVVSALGASIFFENALMLIYGARVFVYPDFLRPDFTVSLFGYQIPGMRLLVIAVSVVLMIALQVFMLRTKVGAAMRAVAIDQGAARLMGINVNRIISLVFLIGPGLGGAAGILVGIYYGQIDFLMGWSYGLKAFTAAILGGIGNIPGAMVGGLLLGVVEAMASAYFAVAWKDAVAFFVLILILIVRPTGLLGERTADKL